MKNELVAEAPVVEQLNEIEHTEDVIQYTLEADGRVIPGEGSVEQGEV